MLAAFAGCPDPSVQGLVHAVSGAVSGNVGLLLGLVVDHLNAARSFQSGYGGSGGSVGGGGSGLEDGLLALGSLCGAGQPPEAVAASAAGPGPAAVCGELCRHPDALKRLLGVVQGTEPAARDPASGPAALTAATRLFEALCANGAPLPIPALLLHAVVILYLRWTPPKSTKAHDHRRRRCFCCC